MDGDITQLRERLFATDDANEMWEYIERLLDRGAEAREALAVVADYLESGRMRHLHSLILGQFVSHIPDPDASWAPFFQRHLGDPDLRYWSIVGYIRSVGRRAYPELIAIAADSGLRLQDRACAVKQLALHGRQRFDRDLPEDPGHWREVDLRLDEVREWASAGYPRGAGYPSPIRHPALDHPITAFEQVVARLDRLLAYEREQRQDPANPSDWLAVAHPTDIEAIQRQWRLPAQYADFLTRFSPVNALIYADMFINFLRFYGAQDLIEGQRGYAYGLHNETIPNWPAHLLVIGDDGGDPYVLDLAQANGNEAPVYTAMHGVGD